MTAFAGRFTVATHVLGLVLAATVMRPGAILSADRAAYHADEPLAWKLAWGVWIVAALAFLAFQVTLRVRLALILALLAVAVDLYCDWIWIVEVPALAGRGESFAALEVRAFVGGAVVANGLYTLAVLMTGIALKRERFLTAAVAVFGFGFSAVSLFWIPALIPPFTGATILAYCAWAWRMARP